MSNLLALLGYILVLSGLGFNLSACVGIGRLSSPHWRLQTAIKGAAAGTILILIGVFLIQGLTPVGIKALVLSLIMLIMIPAAAHAMARSADQSLIPKEQPPEGSSVSEEEK